MTLQRRQLTLKNMDKDVLIKDNQNLAQDNIVRPDAEPEVKNIGKFSGVPEHKHDDKDLPKVDFKDIKGFVEVVLAAPTHIPKNIFDQIKIFDNAGTPTLYVYDYVANTWRAFT